MFCALQVDLSERPRAKAFVPSSGKRVCVCAYTLTPAWGGQKIHNSGIWGCLTQRRGITSWAFIEITNIEKLGSSSSAGLQISPKANQLSWLDIIRFKTLDSLRRYASPGPRAERMSLQSGPGLPAWPLLLPLRLPPSRGQCSGLLRIRPRAWEPGLQVPLQT